MRVREATRRLALGTLLAVGAGVSVGDEAVTAPDTRRGSHAVPVDLGLDLGTTTLHVPRTPATGVVLLLHDRDVRAQTPVLDALAASTLLVPIEATRLVPDGPDTPCVAVVERLAVAARRAQRGAGLHEYQTPVLVGVEQAAGLARAAVLAGDPGLFAGGRGTSLPGGRQGRSPCLSTGTTQDEPRWGAVPARDLPAATAALLAQDVPSMTTGHAPLDRWLAYFRLPLSAAWTAAPRAVLILISDADGPRADDHRLASALAADGVPVLTVDALRYFWQRRSPRDVAFELKRLMGALESLDVPILVGGTGFGAETMAVATRFIEDAPVSGLVLIEPGPSAFFEVEPPLPALVPLLRRDWSTADAVAALDVPTLCLASDDERARVLCRDLARSGRVTLGKSGDAETSTHGRAATIAAFARAQQSRASDEPDAAPGRQPRKPRT